jgi:hypothetical protein
LEVEIAAEKVNTYINRGILISFQQNWKQEAIHYILRFAHFYAYLE